MAPKKKYWVFRNAAVTLHLPQGHVHAGELEPLPTVKRDKVTYIIGQLECAPSTGRLHWQIYVQLPGPTTVSMLRTIFNQQNNIHVEECRGSFQENYDYVTKSESRVEGVPRLEWGTPKDHARLQQQQTRVSASTSSASTSTSSNDKIKVPAAVVHMLRHENATLRDVEDKYPSFFLCQGRNVKDFHTTCLRDASNAERPVYVEVRWGDTGTGKSHSIYHPCPKFPDLTHWDQQDVYFKRSLDKWFPCYDPTRHMVLVLDDIYPRSPEDMSNLLTWLDVYTCMVEFKGGNVVAAWRHVVITSNVNPDEWFPLYRGAGARPGDEVRVKAVMDRIKRITHYTGASLRSTAEAVPWKRPVAEPPTAEAILPPQAGDSQVLADGLGEALVVDDDSEDNYPMDIRVPSRVSSDSPSIEPPQDRRPLFS